MVEQVVGLEFVTSGEREIVSSIARVDSAQKKLQATSNALAQAQKRNAGSEEAVIKAYLALERSGLSYSDVLSGLRQDSQMAQKSAQQYNNALLGVDKAHKSARSSADVFRDAVKANEAALEQQVAETKQAAAADAALAREKDRLIQKLNPLRSASMLYEKELRDINEATRLGAINDRQRQQSLDALNAEFQAFSTGAQGAAMANNRFGVQSQMAGRRTNQLGVLMQQTGYQVGDFAVQVQGGTNVMVALGQQATQLVGTFGMLAKSTRMIGVFAGLGILIPILTGIGAYFLRMSESAEEATEQFEGVSDALETIGRVRLSDVGSDMLETAIKIKQEYNDILDIIERVSLRELQKKLQEPFNALIADLEAFERRSSLIAQIGGRQPDFENQFGLETRNEAIFLATQLRNLDGETKEELQAQLEAISEALFFRGILTDEVEEMLVKLSQEVGLLNSIEESTNSVSDATDGISRGLGEAVNQAMRLRDALNEAMSAGMSQQDKITILRAQIAAAQGGRSVEGAAAQAETAIALGRAGATADQIAAAAARAGQGAETEAALRAQLSDLTRTPSSPTSGSGENVVDINTILDARRQQIEQERVLLGLTGQQREAQAIYFDLLKQNEEAVNRLTDAELMRAANVLAAEQEKNRVIEDGLKRQQDISNLLESSMERAFMSIIDGTMSVKDAFKAMASDIIKELYRIFVVKQITGMIANAIFPGSGALVANANGNAFGNGNVIPFANGGVVGSPTTFPMAGGKTGLMGEAGPEAIMPLKRGKDGKLGVAADGGGSVNIVQNFNISANGDDSVKRIVRQQIPQIAEATKAAVVDAKRRGGSYGRAFG